MLDSCKFQGFVAKFSRYLPLSGTSPPRNPAPPSAGRISWYRRAIRAASFRVFCSLPLPKTPEAPSVSAFFQA